MKNSVSFCLMLSAVALFLGCSRGVATYPASGTVKMDGQPLADAKVHFSSSSVPQVALGTTDASGNFSLAYMNKSGAPAGDYTVVINKRGVDPDNPPAVIELIPGRYNVKSKLTATVNKGETNQFNFDLTSEPDADSGGNSSNADQDPDR